MDPTVAYPFMFQLSPEESRQFERKCLMPGSCATDEDFFCNFVAPSERGSVTTPRGRVKHYWLVLDDDRLVHFWVCATCHVKLLKMATHVIKENQLVKENQLLLLSDVT